jgi:hypothetical protein
MKTIKKMKTIKTIKTKVKEMMPIFRPRPQTVATAMPLAVGRSSSVRTLVISGGTGCACGKK